MAASYSDMSDSEEDDIDSIAEAIRLLQARYPDKKDVAVSDHPKEIAQLSLDMQEEIGKKYTLSDLIGLYLATRPAETGGYPDADVQRFIRGELADLSSRERWDIIRNVNGIETYPSRVAMDVLMLRMNNHDSPWTGWMDYYVKYMRKYFRTMSKTQLHDIGNILRGGGRLERVRRDLLAITMRYNLRSGYMRETFFSPFEGENIAQGLFHDTDDDWRAFTYLLHNELSSGPPSAKHDTVFSEIWRSARECMTDASRKWLQDMSMEARRYRMQLFERTGYVYGDEYYNEMCQSLGIKEPGATQRLERNALKWHFRDRKTLMDRLKKASVITEDDTVAENLSTDVASYTVIAFLVVEKNEEYAKQALAQLTEYRTVLGLLRPFMHYIIGLDKGDEVVPAVRFIAEHSAAVHKMYPTSTTEQRVGRLFLDS